MTKSPLFMDWPANEMSKCNGIDYFKHKLVISYLIATNFQRILKIGIQFKYLWVILCLAASGSFSHIAHQTKWKMSHCEKSKQINFLAV